MNSLTKIFCVNKITATSAQCFMGLSDKANVAPCCIH